MDKEAGDTSSSLPSLLPAELNRLRRSGYNVPPPLDGGTRM